MDKNTIVEKTGQYVKGRLEGDSSGHDWWHILRVTRLATYIAEKEGADLFTVQMAALLHDLDDWKLKGEESGPNEAREWLESMHIDKETSGNICRIIEDMSFKGTGVETRMGTLEGKVVQDADRLDAVGAIGIARAFAYGGAKARQMHNPEVRPQMHRNFAEYKNSKGTTVNHFYEKLLLLKDRMNTITGKRIAAERHSFMELFLQRFLEEWKG